MPCTCWPPTGFVCQDCEDTRVDLAIATRNKYGDPIHRINTAPSIPSYFTETPDDTPDE